MIIEIKDQKPFKLSPVLKKWWIHRRVWGLLLILLALGIGSMGLIELASLYYILGCYLIGWSITSPKKNI